MDMGVRNGRERKLGRHGLTFAGPSKVETEERKCLANDCSVVPRNARVDDNPMWAT